MSHVFWIACFGAVVWCAIAFVGLGVSASYHPMAAKGDLLHPLRMLAVVGALLTGLVMLVIWMQRRPLAPRTYVIGLVSVAVIAVVPLLPRIDSGYEHAYFLGDQRHDIPWQYSPSAGDDERGGVAFRVRVALPDMTQSYRALSQTVTLSKAIDFNYGRGGDAPAEICTNDTYTTECQWREGAFVYGISGDNGNFPQDIEKPREDAVRLLDSFGAAPE